ncbi:MAG: alpha/beta hydrolase [Gemmatimonadaceae bacterium]|nr:alpha/beta hydrolase [Gemmatimonadaceae bacterium]
MSGVRVARLAGLAAALCLALPLDAQVRMLRSTDIDALPAKPPTARLAYGDDPLQFGDLRLPEGAGPFPVVIVVHGGCWLARYGVQNSTALADALRDAGFATWNIEYRRMGDAGGGWPGTFLDVGRAADHVRVLARRHPLDLTRVVAIGHSAGGQLALWLAAAPNVPAASPVHRDDPIVLKGAVALAGIFDLEDFRTYSANTCGDVVDPLLGGTPAQVPERLAAVSPRALLPFPVPHVQITGSLDLVMPAAALAKHEAAARASGSAFELIVLDGLGHHELMSPRTAAFPVIVRALQGLLAR